MASVAVPSSLDEVDEHSYSQKRDRALVPGVLLNINSYLSPQDSAKLKSVCKEWTQIVPRKLVLAVKDWHGKGLYRDVDRVFISETVNLGKEGLESIYIKCKWKDQGWGNKKGRIVVKLFRPEHDGNLYLVAQCKPFGIAEHQWQIKEIVLTSTHLLENGVISKSQNGDVVQFWRYSSSFNV